MTDSHVETEFKLRIDDEAGFERLLAELGASDLSPAEQTNHFFDSEDSRLRAARMALRLREENGAFTITLKGKGTGDGVLTTRGEVETVVDASTAESILSGARSTLDALEAAFANDPPELAAAARACLGDGALTYLGAFTNERRRVGPRRLGADGPEVVLELDRVQFPGVPPQFELELEINTARAEACERELRALFERLDLGWGTSPSKAARFFALTDPD